MSVVAYLLENHPDAVGECPGLASCQRFWHFLAYLGLAAAFLEHAGVGHETAFRILPE